MPRCRVPRGHRRDAVPTLFLFEPCSAEKLCEKYEGWSAIDDAMVTSQRALDGFGEDYGGYGLG